MYRTFLHAACGVFCFASALSARQIDPAPVPEPATLILLATGIGAAVLALRKRRNR